MLPFSRDSAEIRITSTTHLCIKVHIAAHVILFGDPVLDCFIGQYVRFRIVLFGHVPEVDFAILGRIQAINFAPQSVDQICIGDSGSFGIPESIVQPRATPLRCSPENVGIISLDHNVGYLFHAFILCLERGCMLDAYDGSVQLNSVACRVGPRGLVRIVDFEVEGRVLTKINANSGSLRFLTTCTTNSHNEAIALRDFRLRA